MSTVFEAIFAEANAAAVKAETEFLEKYGEPMYCGFAWISIGDGRKPFAKWAAKNGLASPGYPKGMEISYYTIKGLKRRNTQSMDLKEHVARAFAEVLRSYDIPAYMRSRAD